MGPLGTNGLMRQEPGKVVLENLLSLLCLPSETYNDCVLHSIVVCAVWFTAVIAGKYVSISES